MGNICERLRLTGSARNRVQNQLDLRLMARMSRYLGIR